MDSQNTVGKRKIIQKRIKKKERYARMARIRYRKEKNVPLAFVQPLPDVYESIDPRTSYQFYMDILAVEENGKLSSDYSLLNRIKICNSVSVLQEKDNMLSLKLQEYNLAGSNAWESTVKEWEARGGKYWPAWAARIRKFSMGYEEFFRDYRKMLEEGSLDKKLAQRKNEFLAKRNKIMDTHPCIELRFKFEKEEMKMTELNMTSGLLSILGYRSEDFIDGILRDGFPRIHLNQNEGLLGVFGCLMDNFKSLFSKDLEIPKQETILVGQYQSVKRTLFNTLIGGFFNKTTPEINMIIMFDKPEPLRELQFSSVYLKDYTPKKVQHDAERRSFVQRFYWDGESEGSIKQQDVCGIKQLEDSHHLEKETKMFEEPKQELALNLKALQASNTPPQMPMGYLGFPHAFQTLKPFSGNLLQQFEKSIELFGEKLVYLKNKY